MTRCGIPQPTCTRAFSESTALESDPTEKFPVEGVTMRYIMLFVVTLTGLGVAFLSPHDGSGAAVPARKQFADFGHMEHPQAYAGKVFRLSQQYPETMPKAANRPAFLAIDFEKNWRKYLLAVRDYCF